MVYELPEGQGLDRWNDIARAAREGHISTAVQALVLMADHKPRL